MPDNRVRVGVVGTSWYADLMHLPNLKSHPHVDLAAICGRQREPAEKLAATYGIAQVYSDYRELIEKGKLDALVVATPDDLHYPITMEALDAGLHVLCEKPLAVTAEQGRAMAAKAEAADVTHMTYFTWRWVPHYQYLRHLIDGGYIGRCYHCLIRYTAGYGRDGTYEWRFDGRRSNGILGDLGSHMIDMARWLVGEIASVSGHITTFAVRPGLDGQPLDPANDSALLALQFENGAQGSIHVTAMAHVAERGQEGQVILYGESGTLEANLTFIGSEIRGARHDQPQFETLPVPDAYWGNVERSVPYFDRMMARFRTESIGTRLFVDAILAGESVSPSFHDGLRVVEVIDAAFASDRAAGSFIKPGVA